MQGQHVKGLETVSALARRGYKLARLIRGERVYLRFLGSRSLHVGCVARGINASLTASLRALWSVVWM